MDSNTPDTVRISVVVPVYNASETLDSCLEALRRTAPNKMEIIVVNDSSTDQSPSIAAKHGVQVIENPRRMGAASARNAGAKQATGDVILFIDSDVVVHNTTLKQVKDHFEGCPQLAAVFGSYDSQPASSNFLSQYRNLFHHFIHQNSKEDAVTFWAGCGAIRKSVFHAMGGFNEKEYTLPSIEDIELGLRLWHSGYSIRLDKNLQVKHLKRWNILNLIRTDVLQRAYPWSRLIFHTRILPDQLNLQPSHRMSAAFIGLAVVGLPLMLLNQVSILIILAGIALIFFVLVFLNRNLYRFFLSHRGYLFAAGAVFWHFFYYFYSGVTFLFCWFQHQIQVTRHKQVS